jgi:hypothetical protein
MKQPGSHIGMIISQDCTFNISWGKKSFFFFQNSPVSQHISQNHHRDQPHLTSFLVGTCLQLNPPHSFTQEDWLELFHSCKQKL